MRVSCIFCKGRDPSNCGRSFCPITAKAESMYKVRDSIKVDSFQGSSPAPFIGRHGYPHINVGVLSPIFISESAWEYDAPRYWASKEYSIPQIIDFRSSLINSREKFHAMDSGKIIDIVQEVGMASAPVDLDINLKDKPKFRLSTDAYTAPIGPDAQIKKIEVASNPSIHTKVEKAVSDTDLKSNDALVYLYQNNFDENFLSKLLSVGTLGLKRNRKLVPTRWSITATDDLLAKRLYEDVKQFNETGYLAFFGGYLGNFYLILMFPGIWNYELFEMYMPKASFNVNDKVSYTTDYEGYEGRKGYAEQCAGGYYATRLPILEGLIKMKRQASVLALRFITREYAVPLGVWVVREASRKSLDNKPIEFSSQELMLKYACSLVKKKFGFDVDYILKKSVLLKNIREQSKLSHFF